MISQKEGIENSFKYAGEIYDKETGLYYLRARYYDPSVGRFINEDTDEGDISNPLSLNIYGYCYGNPINLSDPTGHSVVAYDGLQDDVDHVKLQLQILSGSENELTKILGMTSDEYAEAYDDGSTREGRISSILSANAEIRGSIMDSNLMKNDSELAGFFSDVFSKGIGSKGLDCVISSYSNGLENWAESYYAFGASGHTFSMSYGDMYNTWAEGVCFTADTLVYTNDGNKPIKEIKIGDEVYSQNVETGEKGLKKVKNVFIHETNELIHVNAGDEEIKVTPTHPFWVKDKGWIMAGQLKVGDKLVMYDGEICEVSSLFNEDLQVPIKVYNFEVEDWHTYFVSQNHVLVHNTCKASELRTWATGQGYELLNIGKSGIEVWGIKSTGEWRLKLKPPSITPGIDPNSQKPRFSARDGSGNYYNPITGKTGSRAELGHEDLEWD